jgi:hypothetical protein
MRSGARIAHDWRMPRDALTLRVDLERGAEPISGTLSDQDGTVHEFIGVLGLIELLDKVRRTELSTPGTPVDGVDSS